MGNKIVPDIDGLIRRQIHSRAPAESVEATALQRVLTKATVLLLTRRLDLLDAYRFIRTRPVT